MEAQYLKVSDEDKKRLTRLGFRTFNQVSVKSGQEKIVAYMVNLSDILQYLESQHEILENIQKKFKDLEDIDKKIKRLKNSVEKKQEELSKIS